jgi:outer membrane protein assembly factor BamB
MKTLTWILIATSWATTAMAEDNWPQWRGAAGTGKTNAVAAVNQWGPNTNIRWRTALPEAGNSSPIAWGGKIFLTQPLSDLNQRAVMCFHRQTGKELWRRGVTYSDDERTHRTNPYCSASPAADDSLVIAWFGSAGLVCWDHNGKQIWQRDLGRQVHQWGYGSSPILHEDLCILNFGPGNREFLIAVEKATGKTVWKVEAWEDAKERKLSGPENDGGANDFERSDQRAQRLRGSWSTPVITSIDGKIQMLVTLPRRIASFDPVTGELLWICGGGAPLAYASPMESGGIVVGLGGYRGASLAVRVAGRGNLTESQRLWHEPKDGGWLGTGITEGDVLYAADTSGVLHCREMETGKFLWKERTQAGSTWSSITQDGNGLMFLLSKSGTTTVFRPNKQRLDVIAVNALNEPSNASVVIADSEILIRTDKALWSIGQAE